MVDLQVTLGRLRLQNPVLVASGTFGYVREMAGVRPPRAARRGDPQDGDVPRTRRQSDPAHGRDGLGAAQRDRPGQRRHRPLSSSITCLIFAQWARR